MTNDLDRKEKTRQAILRILNLNELRIFGCILYNFDISIIETENVLQTIKEQTPDLVNAIQNQLTAFITVENQKAHIYIYDTFIDNKTIKELMFVIIHEQLHIMNYHQDRAEGLDKHIHNLAADHVINNTMNQDIKSGALKSLSTPKDAFIINNLQTQKLTTREVYDYLFSKTTVKNISRINIPGTNQDIIVDQINGILNVSIEENSTPTSIDQDQELRDFVEQIKSEVRILIDSDLIAKGSISGNLKTFIEKIIEVEIPWDKLLERAILTSIAPSKDNRTWSTPMKRYRAHNIILPGSSVDKKISTGVISIDTSGSISEKNLQQFSSIIIQSLSRFEQLWIIHHDVRIHKNKIVKCIDAQNDHFELLNYKGRGGTSHKHVFGAIEEKYKEYKIGIYIMLTDFCSDIEQIWNNYNWTKIIPTSVVLTEKHNIPQYIDPNPIVIKNT